MTMGSVALRLKAPDVPAEDRNDVLLDSGPVSIDQRVRAIEVALNAALPHTAPRRRGRTLLMRQLWFTLACAGLSVALGGLIGSLTPL